MSERVFVSYAREDSDFVLRLVSDLKSKGLPIWVDKLELSAGDLWDDAIAAALREAQTVVVVLSPDAAKSRHVANEISRGLDDGKRVVPIMLRECEIPFQLTRIQRFDFSAGYEESLPAFVDTLMSTNTARANRFNSPNVGVELSTHSAQNLQPSTAPAILSLLPRTSKRIRLGVLGAAVGAIIAGCLWFATPQKAPKKRGLTAANKNSLQGQPQPIDFAKLVGRDLLPAEWVAAVIPSQNTPRNAKEGRLDGKEGGLFGGDKFTFTEIPLSNLEDLNATHPGIRVKVPHDQNGCGANKYRCQLYVATVEDIVANEVLVGSFAARCASALCRTEFAFNGFNPETRKDEPYSIPMMLGEVTVEQKWEYCRTYFRAPKTFAKGTAVAMIRLGLVNQEVQIASLNLKAYGVQEGTLPAASCVVPRSNHVQN
jgi:hypothetical protein